MTADEQAIRGRAEKATPGPWHRHTYCRACRREWQRLYDLRNPRGSRGGNE